MNADYLWEYRDESAGEHGLRWRMSSHLARAPIPEAPAFFYLGVGWGDVDRWVVPAMGTDERDAFAEDALRVFPPAKTDLLVAGWGVPWLEAEPLIEEADPLVAMMGDVLGIDGLLKFRRFTGGNVEIVTPWLECLGGYYGASFTCDRIPPDALERMRGKR